MPGFSPEWLTLREPADHAARNPAVLAAVASSMAGRDVLRAIDLGCGTGSNLRGCALALSATRQQWTLVDSDAMLLDTARQQLIAWADEASRVGDNLVLIKTDHTLAVSFSLADLSTDIDRLLSDPCDLVTAAALFDLVSPAWIERVAGLLSARALPLYTVLTYNGEESWLPRHEADAGIHRAFLSHQQRDKGFGPAAGPAATRLLEALLRGADFEVTTGESPWSLTASDHQLVTQLAAGIASAAGETGELHDEIVSEWLAFRTGVAGETGSTATIGHLDLWAAPKPRQLTGGGV